MLSADSLMKVHHCCAISPMDGPMDGLAHGRAVGHQATLLAHYQAGFGAVVVWVHRVHIGAHHLLVPPPNGSGAGVDVERYQGGGNQCESRRFPSSDLDLPSSGASYQGQIQVHNLVEQMCRRQRRPRRAHFLQQGQQGQQLRHLLLWGAHRGLRLRLLLPGIEVWRCRWRDRGGGKGGAGGGSTHQPFL